MASRREEPATPRRLFVALRVEPELAERIDFTVGWALGAERSLRRVPPERLHLTLLFLGLVEADPARRLEQALGRELAGLARPDLEIGAGGCFPGRGRPRVWWLGLAEREGAVGRLARLRSAVLAAARAAGLGAAVAAEEERAFRPHLTVARARGRGDRQPKRDVRRRFERIPPPGPWTPAEVALVESRLGSGSARYTNLARFELVAEPTPEP